MPAGAVNGENGVRCIAKSQHRWLEIVGHLLNLLGRDADGAIEWDARAG